MGREIKFRAWNPRSKQMVDSSKIVVGAIDSETNKVFLPFCEGLIPMEFTGLHDLSGNPIYEGDIIKNVHGHILTVSIPEIYYMEFSYALEAPDMEVIGNIYENPELLQEASHG